MKSPVWLSLSSKSYLHNIGTILWILFKSIVNIGILDLIYHMYEIMSPFSMAGMSVQCLCVFVLQYFKCNIRFYGNSMTKRMQNTKSYMPSLGHYKVRTHFHHIVVSNGFLNWTVRTYRTMRTVRKRQLLDWGSSFFLNHAVCKSLGILYQNFLFR